MAATFITHAFTHPQLGPLTGRLPSSAPNVTHFRSIPFARIPGRFRQCVLITHFDENSSRDFTEYGTACPAPPQGHENSAIGGPLPDEQERVFDEYSCLNLTVSAPKKTLGEEDAALPVMVYIHGGALKEGGGHVSALHGGCFNGAGIHSHCSAYLDADTTRLVDLSIREEHPMIIVSIHYRLNWLGFLACQDLLNFAQTHNESPSNFGLYDQRTAFFWIHRFISGFGGDPKRITAFGESAGSASIAMHMTTSVPLFNRAILMSGTAATGPPVAMKYKEAEYLALLKYLGIDEQDPKRFEKLMGVEVEKIVEAIEGVQIPIFRALAHESFFERGNPTWWTENKLIGECEWVDDIMIGDCFYEGWLFKEPLRHLPLDKFIDLTATHLGPTNSKQLLQIYNISPDMDHNLFWSRLTYLMGDIAFSEPAHKLATSLSLSSNKKVYRYTLTMRNPFPGSDLYQIPGHHFIDLLYLFRTLRDRYSRTKDKEISDEFGKRWLAFGAGKEPWDEYKEGEEKIMVVSGREGWVVKSREVDEVESKEAEEGERRYRCWEVLGDVMRDLVTGERGEVKGEETRLAWGPEGGIYRLVGMEGPSGVVIP